MDFHQVRRPELGLVRCFSHLLHKRSPCLRRRSCSPTSTTAHWVLEDRFQLTQACCTTRIGSSGDHGITDRDLYLLELVNPFDMPAQFALSSPHFACFLAWDATEASVEEIDSVLRPLLASGVGYLCTWGADCQRVHDIADELFDPVVSPKGTVVMTTWHDEETLAEAVEFFLNCSFPHEYYEETLRSGIAISIGSPPATIAIAGMVSNPDEFRRLRDAP